MNREYECLVSVLCTTYNHEKYIRQCLDSMVGQKTDFPFEIIVRDDCSTDSTGDIIREYGEKYPGKVIPFILEFNHFSRGLTNDSFAKMFGMARGKYIAICEGDDFWTEPEKLQVQTDYLEAHPEGDRIHREEDLRREASGCYIYGSGAVSVRAFRARLHRRPGILRDRQYCPEQ